MNNLGGRKVRTYVHVGTDVIAEQNLTNHTTAPTETIEWKRRDVAATSVYAGGRQQAVDLQGITTEAPDYA